MSPKMRERRDGSVKPSRYRAVQPMALVWLTLVWLALWGAVTPMLVVSGVLVAVLVCVVFPLPPVALDLSFHPWRAVVLFSRFLYDILVASVQVAGVVLRPRPVRNAVVAVDLETTSDFVLTGVAAMLSLVPGSVVIEARRSTHTLYLHVLDVPDEAAADRFRQRALAQEQRFLAAFTPREPGEGGSPAPAATDSTSGGAR